jgi:cytochrome c
MKVLTAAVAAAALLIAAPSMASDDVMVKNKCNTCHDATAKKVGPTWKDVAAKASEADIKAAIEKGAKGKYGKIPMPPQPNAKADADALVKAIMAHK